MEYEGKVKGKLGSTGKGKYEGDAEPAKQLPYVRPVLNRYLQGYDPHEAPLLTDYEMDLAYAASRTPDSFVLFMELEESKGRSLLNFVTIVMSQVSLSNINGDYEVETQFLHQMYNYDEELFEAYLMENMSYLKQVKDLQTPEMCQRIMHPTYMENCFQFFEVFEHVVYKTDEMIRQSIKIDYRCLRFVEPSQELYDLAVRHDAMALHEVPKAYQTEYMVRTAITQKPKSVNAVLLEGEVLENALLLAIEMSPHAMPAPYTIAISRKVQDTYRAMCIEKGFYPTEWAKHFNFTEQELKEILSKYGEKKKSGPAMFDIYKSLPYETQREIGLTWEQPGTLPVSQGAFLHLGLDDEYNYEEVARLFVAADAKAKRGYLCWLAKQGHVQKVTNLLSRDGLWIKFINEEWHNETYAYCAVRQNKEAIRYCAVLSPRVIREAYKN